MNCYKGGRHSFSKVCFSVPRENIPDQRICVKWNQNSPLQKYCKNICLQKIFPISGFGSSETKRRLCKNIAKCNSIDAGKKWISWCTPWFDLILFIFGLIIICVHFLFSQNKLYLCKKGRRKKTVFFWKKFLIWSRPPPLYILVSKS